MKAQLKESTATDLLQNVLGNPIQEIQAVSGGDINLAFKIITSRGAFFAKMSTHPDGEEMFEVEADSLKQIRDHTEFQTPIITATGKYEDVAYLIMPFLHSSPGSNADWALLGRKLAQMHKNTQNRYGYYHDGFIATIPQSNRWNESWSTFYLEQRLDPLFQRCRDEGLLKRISSEWSEFCHVAMGMLEEQKPALIHGDLWSGNVLFTKDHGPQLIDPALYYGSRELDLAMSRLFGGFDRRFYEAYSEEWPLQDGWQERLPLYQLYYLLVHVLLFGGNYERQSEDLIRGVMRG